MNKETYFVFVVLLCLIMGFSLTFFIIYHFSMVRFDKTTNERVKRSDFTKQYRKEFQ